MLFKNIGIIDENFEYKADMFVGTENDRITYIGGETPEDEARFNEVYDGKGKLIGSASGKPKG